MSKKIINTKIQTTSHQYKKYDMVHIPATFRVKKPMRFRVTVRKQNVMDGRTDRRTLFNISHPGPSAWREIIIKVLYPTLVGTEYNMSCILKIRRLITLFLMAPMKITKSK